MTLRLTRPALALSLCAMLLGAGAMALAQKRMTPIGPQWWPSEWGADDQRGAANRLTPQKVLQANALIKTGKIYQLGRVMEEDMPLPGKRRFVMSIPGSPTHPVGGTNRGVGFDELFTGEIGQLGTQFDGLGHVGCRLEDDDYFYNGFKRSEFATARGFTKLGIENVGPIFTRGVLVDVAGYKGVERLAAGYVISPADLQNALQKQGVEITPGDAVLIHTGHGRLWKKDNEAFVKGEPGIGRAAAEWLVGQKIVLAGSDNWAIEAVPHEDPALSFPVHNIMLTRNGIYHHECMDLTQLAADRVYEFAYIFSPIRLKGATGSPGNPIAVR